MQKDYVYLSKRKEDGALLIIAYEDANLVDVLAAYAMTTTDKNQKEAALRLFYLLSGRELRKDEMEKLLDFDDEPNQEELN